MDLANDSTMSHIQETEVGGSTTTQYFTYPGTDPMPTLSTRCFRHYAFYVIFVFGFVSNSVALCVLGGSRRMRRSVSGVFLLALGVCDNLVLVTQLISKLLRSPYYWDITRWNCPSETESIPANMISCSVIMYLKYTFRCLSTLIVLCISVHRFAVVVFPLSRHLGRFSNTRAAIVQVIAAVVTSLVASIYATNFSPAYDGCQPGHQRSYEIGVTVVDVILCDIIASSVILVMSLWTVAIFVKAGQRMLQRKDSHTNHARKRGERHMTVLLLTVAFSFILMRMPYTVTWLPVWFSTRDKKISAKLLMVNDITECVSLLNHAINLYIYCICSRGFRDEMRFLFTRRHRRISRVSRGSSKKTSTTTTSGKTHPSELEVFSSRGTLMVKQSFV